VFKTGHQKGGSSQEGASHRVTCARRGLEQEALGVWGLGFHESFED